MVKRPVNLNLLTIRFPLTAWVSILHRMSGLMLIFLIPYLLWILQESLASLEHFKKLQQQFNQPFFISLTGLVFVGLVFHLIAGIRHLLMDNHIGVSLQGVRIGAKVVIIEVCVILSTTLFFILR